jgi:hypothetical protein
VPNNVSSFLGSLSPKIQKEVERELLQITQDIQEEASSNHRYTTRSGMLDRAYTTVKFGWSRVKHYLDKWTKSAPYAYAIALGRKDWPKYKPDPFYENAVKKIDPEIEKRILNAVNRATK